MYSLVPRRARPLRNHAKNQPGSEVTTHSTAEAKTKQNEAGQTHHGLLNRASRAGPSLCSPCSAAAPATMLTALVSRFSARMQLWRAWQTNTGDGQSEGRLRGCEQDKLQTVGSHGKSKARTYIADVDQAGVCVVDNMARASN